MGEVWKDILTWENLYQVSSYGRIKSVRNGIILTEKRNPNGYPIVTLYDKKRVKEYTVHRIVAKVFIPNPNNYPIINHKDEVRHHNTVDNLEWCTYKYNMNYGHCQEKKRASYPYSDKQRETLMRGREKMLAAKRRAVLQYSKDGEFIARFDSTEDARRAIGVGYHSHIPECALGKRKTAHGYIWRYERGDDLSAK